MNAHEPPARPILILLDLLTQVMILLLVQLRIIQTEHLIDKQHILAPVQVLQQRIIAPIEKCFSDRRKSHAQHPRQHPPPKDLRTAKHCQLRQNPCREENGHIRRDCTEQAVQGQNREKPRRYTMQFLDGAQMHCSSLAHRYFFLHIQNAFPS